MRRFCDHYQVDPRVSIEVSECIPQHVGLGSGTQLALAIGLGLAMVCGIDANVWDVASAMGRGRRSGIGTAAFQTGGFVVDAGHKRGGIRSGRGADGGVAPRSSRRLALCRGRSRRGRRSERAQRRGGLRSVGAVGADLRGDQQDHAAQTDAGPRRARHRGVRPRLDCGGPQDRRVLLGCAGRHIRRGGDQRGRRCSAARRRLRGGTEFLGAGGLWPRAREGCREDRSSGQEVPGGRLAERRRSSRVTAATRKREWKY